MTDASSFKIFAPHKEFDRLYYRKRPDSFHPSDEFALMPTTHRIKTEVVKKQADTMGPVTISVKEKEYGLEVKYGKKSFPLIGDQQFLPMALKFKKGAVVSCQDFNKDDPQLLRQSVYRLRDTLQRELGLDSGMVMDGFRLVYGQGYRLDSSVLKLQLREQPSRQRGVVPFELP